MKNESYSATIEVAKSAQDVFNAIKEVTKWWNKEDFKGHSSKLNDEFIINHPSLHYSKQQLIEVIPAEKIMWLVTDSTLHWLEKDKHEWTGTKMIFEIAGNHDKARLRFTHEGLIPEKKCYAMCEKGWAMIIKDWLVHFIIYGTPSPELTKAAEIRNKMLNER